MKKEKCEWCGKKEYVNKHHYPIQKKDGGKKTVSICICCHNLYHRGILINAMDCKNEEEVNKKICDALKKCFPLINPKLVIINPEYKWET